MHHVTENKGKNQQEDEQDHWDANDDADRSENEAAMVGQSVVFGHVIPEGAFRARIGSRHRHHSKRWCR